MSQVKRHVLRRDLKRNGTLYLILLPVLAFYIIFHYIPMFGVFLAFKDYNYFQGIFGSAW